MPIKTGRIVLERLLAAAQRRRGPVFAAAAAAAVVGAVLVSRLSFDPNVLRLLPRQAPAVRAFEKFLINFGSLDHLYILFESPDAIADHADLIDAYVEGLRRAPEIASVDAALFEADKDWSYLYDRELFLLGPAGASEALARLQPPALDRELAHARDRLQTPGTAVKTLVQQDPLGLLGLLRDRFAGQKAFARFDPTQPGYVSPDGRSRLLIVKPRGEPFDTDFCRALLRRLDQIERDVRGSADDGASAAVTIQAAGAYRVSAESEAVIRRETIVNSIGSLVLLLAIVIGVFRTPWMLVFGTVPLALAAVLALGLAGLARHGRLSPATSGSAAMLFGLGIDGIVLLCMRYLEARDQGASPADACRRMAGTASEVVLAQTTTAATFLALLLIDFPSLNDLGWLVGGGILLTCLFTLLLLPPMLGRGSRRRGRTVTAAWLARLVAAHPTGIIAAGIAATVGLGAAAPRLRLDMSLEQLQARTAGSDLEREVARRFSLPTDVLLVLNEGPRIEPLLETDARLAEAFRARMPEVAVSGVSALIPTSESQRAVAAEIQRSGATAETAARALAAGAARAGFRPGAFQPFLDRLPRLLDPSARITYAGLVEHGLESIVSRFLVERAGRYAAVTYLYPDGAADLAAIEATVRSVDSRLELSGLPAINRELASRFPREFAKGLIIGTIAVGLLIYGAFRSLRSTLLALLPTAAGFVWSAGILALLHVRLDLFSVFAAVVCVGMAVDYGIYVLGRYAGESAGDVGEVLTRTGAAIIVACATALVGFGTLVDSSYAPLRAFGLVCVVTLACCLAASLLFLPAILARGSRQA